MAIKQCDHLLMDQQDAEQRIAELERELAQQKRIAELERQLAEAKAAGGGPAPDPSPVSGEQLAAIDEHARRLAQALLAERAGSAGPPAAPLREALTRAVVDAGLTPEQYREVLKRAGLRAGGKITVGGQVVYDRCDPHDPVFLAPSRLSGYAIPGAFGPPRSQAGGANRVGAVIGVLGGGLGLCLGGAAAVTAVFPASALWMSPIVCRSGYDLGYNTSHYSYKPGQSGTSVSFQCVGDTDYYDASDFAVFALQSLLAMLVAVVVLVIGGLLWRRAHRPR
jgi:hypothetical protein